MDRVSILGKFSRVTGDIN